MSSLDAARRHALTPGVWRTPLAAANAARAQLATLPGLILLQDGTCGAQQSVSGFDPLRLVVNVGGLGLTGYDAAEWLEQQHSIVPELATQQVGSLKPMGLKPWPGGLAQAAWAEEQGATWGQYKHQTFCHTSSFGCVNKKTFHMPALPDGNMLLCFMLVQLVVFVIGPGNTAADADALVAACTQLCKAQSQGSVKLPECAPEHPPKAAPSKPLQPSSHSNAAAAKQPQQQETPNDSSQPAPAAAALTPRQAFFADTEAVPLAAAVGRVSAELLCPYPPGVPAMFPGEVFTPASIQVLQETVAGGGVVTGSHDRSLENVLVVVRHFV